MKKYKNKNKANDSTDGKDNEQKFGKTKFNKLEHARQKYQEQKTAALIMRQVCTACYLRLGNCKICDNEDLMRLVGIYS